MSEHRLNTSPPRTPIDARNAMVAKKAAADRLLTDTTLDPERFGRVAAASATYGECIRIHDRTHQS